MAIHRLVLMAAVIVLMAGCQYDGMVSDPFQEEGDRAALAISFGDGFADNPVHTRAAAVRLSDLDTTMGVWGWFVDADNIERRIFVNQLVNFNAERGKWTYLPEKYWQQDGKNYRFYAYAPHASKVDGAEVTINLATDTMINITGITLKGSNTMSQKPLPLPNGLKTFKNVFDTDWMIARKKKSAYRELVMFNMQHILAKLVVTAKIKPNKGVWPGGCYLVIDSLKVGEFVSKADFTQKLDHTPDPVNDAGINEWTLYPLEPRYTLESSKDDTISSAYELCMIESLLLPQVITPGMELFIWYSVHSSDGHIQHYSDSKKLIDLPAFQGRFSSAQAYKIKIDITPGIIEFQTGTRLWDNLDDYEYLDVSHNNSDGD